MIRRNHQTGQITLDPLRWGLIPSWCKDPKGGEWIRTFAIITTDANELVAEMYDRMPLIVAPSDYLRWLKRRPRSARSDAAVCGRADADVADIDAGQQAGK